MINVGILETTHINSVYTYNKFLISTEILIVTDVQIKINTAGYHPVMKFFVWSL